MSLILLTSDDSIKVSLTGDNSFRPEEIENINDRMQSDASENRDSSTDGDHMRTVPLLAAVVTVAFNMHLSIGQPAQQESTRNDPHLSAGKLVANGESRSPMGDSKLLTYKLEEVDLSNPMDFEIRGKRHHLTTVLRLTITSESISGAHTIWIDDAALPRVFGLGAHAIATFIYDRSILRDGAEISVSDGREFLTLPERLRLPKEFSNTLRPIVEEGNSIVGLHSALRIIGSVRQPLIQIEMRTERGFPIRNAALQLQIGKRFFLNELGVDPNGKTLRVSLSPKVFAELKDGAEVLAGFTFDRSGASANEIWYFGRLNKSMLDR